MDEDIAAVSYLNYILKSVFYFFLKMMYNI